MIKYFYQVIYKRDNFDGNSFDLGVFSTKRNAEIKICDAKKQQGFEDKNNFKIIKFGVKFFEPVDKHNVKLYLVWHEYSVVENGEIYDYCNIFEFFGTKREAEEKRERLKKYSRIGKKYPNNFYIDEVLVDNFSSWSEGYTSH